MFLVVGILALGMYIPNNQLQEAKDGDGDEGIKIRNVQGLLGMIGLFGSILSGIGYVATD